jgi:hypothetical protein
LSARRLLPFFIALLLSPCSQLLETLTAEIDVSLRRLPALLPNAWSPYTASAYFAA